MMFVLLLATFALIQEEEKKTQPPAEEKPPVVTQHEVRLNGNLLRYQVSTGKMPIRKDNGEAAGRDFLHGLYPRGRLRTAIRDPSRSRSTAGRDRRRSGFISECSVRNACRCSLTAECRRLPIGSSTTSTAGSISRTSCSSTRWEPVSAVPSSPEKGKEFWGLEQDIESVAEFIRLYLTRHERWSSPLYLIGESYGTTRAAGLSGYLVDRSGVAFNGVILVSSVLNFQTIRFAEGNDLPYLTYLPTYTATAWYHKKLEPELQADLPKTLAEVKKWAIERYWVALAKGASLAPDERRETSAALSRYTGLSQEFIERADLRVDAGRFRKELLRAEGRTVGRLDSRFVGMDRDAAGEEYEFDPSMAAIRPPYTAAFNDYVREELGYESDLHYWILGGGIGRWDFGDEGRFPDTSKALRDAMLRNSYMKVFVASGYYDMATPFFGTEYTLSHLGVPESLRDNLRVEGVRGGTHDVHPRGFPREDEERYRDVLSGDEVHVRPRRRERPWRTLTAWDSARSSFS